MAEDCIRVYLDCEASTGWATLPCKPDTTAHDLIETIIKRRNVPRTGDEWGLFISDSNHDQVSFERRLEGHERPLEIQETVRKHGQLDGFRFSFKRAPKVLDGGNDGGDSSDEGEGEMFSQVQKVQKMDDCLRAGYLEKRGKRNTGWKKRWFVLQNDQLYYFKSHEHGAQLGAIPVNEAVIRESPNPAATSAVGTAAVTTPAANASSGGPSSSSAANNNGSSQPNGGANGNNWLFEVNTKTRVYHMRARTQADMMGWIKELKKHTTLEAENDIMDEVDIWIEELELERSAADEQRLEELSHLPGVLRNVMGIDYLMQFVVENRCEENLLFWLDAEDYRRGDWHSNEAERRRRGQYMWDKFCKEGSPLEIELGNILRQAIREQLDKGDPTREAFAAAQQKVYTLLHSATFPSFHNSKQWTKLALSTPIVGPVHLEDHGYRRGLLQSRIPPLPFLPDLSYGEFKLEIKSRSAGSGNSLELPTSSGSGGSGGSGSHRGTTVAMLHGNGSASPRESVLFSPSSVVSSSDSPTSPPSSHMVGSVTAGSMNTRTNDLFGTSSTAKKTPVLGHKPQLSTSGSASALLAPSSRRPVAIGSNTNSAARIGRIEEHGDDDDALLFGSHRDRAGTFSIAPPVITPAKQQQLPVALSSTSSTNNNNANTTNSEVTAARKLHPGTTILFPESPPSSTRTISGGNNALVSPTSALFGTSNKPATAATTTGAPPAKISYATVGSASTPSNSSTSSNVSLSTSLSPTSTIATSPSNAFLSSPGSYTSPLPSPPSTSSAIVSSPSSSSSSSSSTNNTNTNASILGPAPTRPVPVPQSIATSPATSPLASASSPSVSTTVPSSSSSSSSSRPTPTAATTQPPANNGSPAPWPMNPRALAAALPTPSPSPSPSPSPPLPATSTTNTSAAVTARPVAIDDPLSDASSTPQVDRMSATLPFETRRRSMGIWSGGGAALVSTAATSKWKAKSLFDEEEEDTSLSPTNNNSNNIPVPGSYSRPLPVPLSAATSPPSSTTASAAKKVSSPNRSGGIFDVGDDIDIDEAINGTKR